MNRPALRDENRGPVNVSGAAVKVLRVYDGLANDENDGEFALWSENDLHGAMHELRLQLADQARREGQR